MGGTPGADLDGLVLIRTGADLDGLVLIRTGADLDSHWC